MISMKKLPFLLLSVIFLVYPLKFYFCLLKVENTNTCDDEQITPIYQKYAIFFANYSSIHSNTVKLVATPVPIATQEAWSLTLSSCQITMAKPDENRTPCKFLSNFCKCRRKLWLIFFYPRYLLPYRCSSL